MLHLIQCRHAAPLWKACLNFCTSVLGSQKPHDTTRAIIFGLHNDTALMGPLARAFLRHAVGAYYAAATKTDKEQVTFVWQRAFLTALTNYRAAVLRHCQSIRLLYVRRKHTIFTNCILTKNMPPLRLSPTLALKAISASPRASCALSN